VSVQLMNKRIALSVCASVYQWINKRVFLCVCLLYFYRKKGKQNNSPQVCSLLSSDGLQEALHVPSVQEKIDRTLCTRKDGQNSMYKKRWTELYVQKKIDRTLNLSSERDAVLYDVVYRHHCVSYSNRFASDSP
jgi:hypothetical protein